MKGIKLLVLNYCIKKVCSYHNKKCILCDIEDLSCYYSIGYQVSLRDKWVLRMEKVERWCMK